MRCLWTTAILSSDDDWRTGVESETVYAGYHKVFSQLEKRGLFLVTAKLRQIEFSVWCDTAASVVRDIRCPDTLDLLALRGFLAKVALTKQAPRLLGILYCLVPSHHEMPDGIFRGMRRRTILVLEPNRLNGGA